MLLLQLAWVLNPVLVLLNCFLEQDNCFFEILDLNFLFANDSSLFKQLVLKLITAQLLGRCRDWL